MRPPVSRVRSGHRRFPELDGVRAVAAYAVLATHAGFASGRSLDDGPFAPLLARFDFGVTLFFLLSGFVIYRPFVVASLRGDPLPATRRFYLRRAARILPAYWLAVAVTLALLSTRPARLSDWLSYLSLLQTYTGHDLDPGLTQMWTLSVELSFYALVPLLAMLVLGGWRRAGTTATSPPLAPASLARRHLALIGSLCALAVCFGLLGTLTSAFGADSLVWLPANLDWFALGMLLALLSAAEGLDALGPLRQLSEIARAGGSCWVAAGLVFWFALLPVAGPRSLVVLTGWQWSTKHYLYALCALLILLPLTLAPGQRIGRWLAWRPLHDLGVISYGVYLWHLPLLIAIQRWLGYRTFGGHFLILFGTAALAATVAATVSWHLVEKRVIGWASAGYASRSTRSEGAAEPAAGG
jgi:peptidoglycan/LPS O-acetylase OafA/YrhL